jgi:hypothetical protein
MHSKNWTFFLISNQILWSTIQHAVCINPLKTQVYLNYIYIYFSYLRQNTRSMYVHYINRGVNAVQGKLAGYCGNYKKQIHKICGHSAAGLNVKTAGIHTVFLMGNNHLSLVVTSYTTGFNVKTLCILTTDSSCVFCTDLRRSSDIFLSSIKWALLYNRDRVFPPRYELNMYISFRLIFVLNVSIGERRISITAWKQVFWTIWHIDRRQVFQTGPSYFLLRSFCNWRRKWVQC